MNVLITGAGGFLGQRLARALLAGAPLMGAPGRAGSVSELVLADLSPPPSGAAAGIRVRALAGDIRDPAFVAGLVDEHTAVIFHLAAVVSGGAESDFELGMSVNLHGSLALLERCRRLAATPRLVFASSVAVYGGDMPEVIDDRTILTPQSSYGTQKAVVELLLNDYSRKGFLDGRCVRLPTIVVRPGKPNLAASSFASGIIREPLQGQPAQCPVPEDTALWVLSPRRAVAGLLHAQALPPDALGASRSIALPGLTVTVGEMLAALAAVAGARVAERVSMVPDPFVAEIVRSWPSRFEPARGLALGFEADASAAEIIEAFIADELAPAG